jgi:hypothetical protein
MGITFAPARPLPIDTWTTNLAGTAYVVRVPIMRSRCRLLTPPSAPLGRRFALPMDVRKMFLSHLNCRLMLHPQPLRQGHQPPLVATDR